MGGSITTTSKTGPTSRLAKKGVNRLIGGFLDQMDMDPPVFEDSLYTPMSNLTREGVRDLRRTANYGEGGLKDAFGYARGVVGSQGYNPALREAQGGIRSFLNESQGNAPGYERLRSRIADDTLSDVNSMFTASGRFGSGSHVGKATESLADNLAGLDYQNYSDRMGRNLAGNQALAGVGQTAMGNAMGAANSIPGLYGSTRQPALDRLQAGSMLDADRRAERMGEFDLFQRNSDADLDRLLKIVPGLASLFSSGPQTQTTTEPGPNLLQTLLGGGIGIGSLLLPGNRPAEPPAGIANTPFRRGVPRGAVA